MTLADLHAVYLFRTACGLIATLAYLGLIWRGIAYARRSRSWRNRIFWATALITLLHWVAILFLSSLYLVFHPPVAIAVDPTPVYLQTYLAAAIAFGGVLLWRYCPRPEDAGR